MKADKVKKIEDQIAWYEKARQNCISRREEALNQYNTDHTYKQSHHLESAANAAAEIAHCEYVLTSLKWILNNISNFSLSKIYTLHLGTWDAHHLHSVFTSKEKAEAYLNKFNFKDNPKIEEIQLDPHDDLVASDNFPYLAISSQQGKIKLKKKELEFYKPGYHFAHGSLYHYFAAKNDEEAMHIAESMRQKLLPLWQENTTQDESNID